VPLLTGDEKENSPDRRQAWFRTVNGSAISGQGIISLAEQKSAALSKVARGMRWARSTQLLRWNENPQTWMPETFIDMDESKLLLWSAPKPPTKSLDESGDIFRAGYKHYTMT
jgi:hypothetical protein